MSRDYVVYTDEEHSEVLHILRGIREGLTLLPVEEIAREPQQELASALGDLLAVMEPKAWDWDPKTDSSEALLVAMHLAMGKS